MVREDVMAWIRVTETYRYRPNQGTCVVYRPGTYNVPTAAATLAVAAGKAVRMTKARKDEEPVEDAVDVGGADGDA